MKQKELKYRIFPFLEWLPDVNRHTLRGDIIAGLTGAVIALPQGLAFAMIAGLPPVYGIYTAIIAPIIAALFGSSRHMVTGPTTPISIVVFSALIKYAEPATPDFVVLALSLTFLAGTIQLALGLLRLGTLVNFVSHTVVVGFTAGAAFLIASSQLKHVLGVQVPRVKGFFPGLWELSHHITETQWAVLAVAMSTLLVAILLKKYLPKSPYMLLAMAIGGGLSFLLGGETAGIAVVGEIPAKLPPVGLPDLSFDQISLLIPHALAVALLGLIEAVAIARSIATKTGQKIDGNQEFIGQGLSNVIGSLFSGYMASGSFTRSGVNHQSGANTPLSSILAALILLTIVLLVAPILQYLPVSAMGGIILLVAWNLIDFDNIRTIFRTGKAEVVTLVVTFASTLLFDLEFAIYGGIVVSLIFYLKRTSTPAVRELVPQHLGTLSRFITVKRTPAAISSDGENKGENKTETSNSCPQLRIIRIDGSLYFGSMATLSENLEEIRMSGEKNLLIVGSGINFVDLQGAELLVTESRARKAIGGSLYLCNLKENVKDFLEKGNFCDEIGRDHVFSDKKEAISAIYKHFEPVICKECKSKIFIECR